MFPSRIVELQYYSTKARHRTTSKSNMDTLCLTDMDPQPRTSHATTQSMADLHGAVLEPDPALTLVRVNAYTGEFVRTLVWPPHSEELVFTAGSVVVAMRADTGAGVLELSSICGWRIGSLARLQMLGERVL